MRNDATPIIGRIEDDMYLMDMRTIQADELPAQPTSRVVPLTSLRG